jgi:hypothetical protein
VFLALGIQREMRKRHFVARGLPGSVIFRCIISQKARFSGKRVLVIKSVSISYTNFVGRISYCRTDGRTDGAKYDKIIFGLHVEYPLFLSDFNEK